MPILPQSRKKMTIFGHFELRLGISRRWIIPDLSQVLAQNDQKWLIFREAPKTLHVSSFRALRQLLDERLLTRMRESRGRKAESTSPLLTARASSARSLPRLLA